VKKYFYPTQQSKRVFHGQVKDPNGKQRRVQLRAAKDMPIKRHVKIRGKANPYDPAWEEYFERRIDVKMEDNLSGRRKLLYLWKEQDGLCPVCREKITKLTGWHSHHLLFRSEGGTDEAANLVLLHPHCHRQVHNQGLPVGKPRSSRSVRKTRAASRETGMLGS
jgi:RNA-directed DNA polymerase